MKWFTIGSANLVDLSFERDHTELNASVWSAKSARSLFLDLAAEHTGENLSAMDGKSALAYLARVATQNREHLLKKEPIHGNLYAVDAEQYCAENLASV